MKFKYRDQVKIEDEFYDFPNGIVTGYVKDIGDGMFYTVKFKMAGIAEYERYETYNENKLTKIIGE